MSDNTIRIDINDTTTLAPAPTTAADEGEIAANVTDRKVFVRDAAGVAVAVADKVMPHDPALGYAQYDLVISGAQIYQCNADIPPKAFTGGDWTAIGGTGGPSTGAILKAPTAATENTIDLTSKPTFNGLVIAPDASQSADLLAAGGVGPDGQARASLGPQGFPSAVFGNEVYEVNQLSHGFSARGQPVGWENGAYVKPISTNPSIVLVGVVEQVIDANHFAVRLGGKIENLQAAAFPGASITANTLYYLSDTTGGLSTSPPSAGRTAPVMMTLTGTEAIVFAQPYDYVSRAGDTMTGALSFGSVFASGTLSLDNHLKIYGGTYGINATSGVLNLVADGGNGIVAFRGDGAYSNGYITAVGSIASETGAIKATTDNGGLQIRHDGGNALIENLGSGDIYLRAGTTTTLGKVLRDTAGNVHASDTLMTRAKGDDRWMVKSGGTFTGRVTFNDGIAVVGGSASDQSIIFNGNGSTGDGMFHKTADGLYLVENGAVAKRIPVGGASNGYDLLSVNDGNGRYALRGITISAGTGLSGGGNLTANRTLSVNKSYFDGLYVPLGRTISAGGGLSGGGSLSGNRTISHSDTSSQGSVNNSSGTVIQDVSLDTYGHVTSLGSTNLDTRYWKNDTYEMFRKSGSITKFGMGTDNCLVVDAGQHIAYIRMDGEAQMGWYGKNYSGYSRDHIRSKAIRDYPVSSSWDQVRIHSSSGEMVRYTSSRKFKRDIDDFDARTMKQIHHRKKSGGVSPPPTEVTLLGLVNKLKPRMWKPIEKLPAYDETPEAQAERDREYETHNVGLVSEEVAAVLPGLLPEGASHWSEDGMIAILIGAIKELIAEKDDLAERLNAVEALVIP